MRRVKPTIRSYEWGMTDSCSPFVDLHHNNSGKVAELWWGSHPKGCLVDKETKQEITTVPFLLKLLFIETPLSLQVHPTSEQIKQHAFPDPLPKPEMIIAMTTLEALCGFRQPSEIKQLISSIPLLSQYPEFSTLFRLDSKDLQHLMTSVFHYSNDRKHEPPYSVFLTLLDLYPEDPATLAPFYMNHVSLTQGQALILPASQPHCYLSGQGLECMPCSDNIVRCGLTRKETDPKLFFILSTMQPVIVQTTYEHPCFYPYFSLHAQPCFGKKNSIVLVLQGEGTINHRETRQGDSWMLDTDQPIVFNPDSLHIMMAMPCTNIEKQIYS